MASSALKIFSFSASGIVIENSSSRSIHTCAFVLLCACGWVGWLDGGGPEREGGGVGDGAGRRFARWQSAAPRVAGWASTRTSTASKLSRPKSLVKCAVGVTFAGSTFSMAFSRLTTRSVTSFLSRKVCAGVKGEGRKMGRGGGWCQNRAKGGGGGKGGEGDARQRGAAARPPRRHHEAQRGGKKYGVGGGWARGCRGAKTQAPAPHAGAPQQLRGSCRRCRAAAAGQPTAAARPPRRRHRIGLPRASQPPPPTPLHPSPSLRAAPAGPHKRRRTHLNKGRPSGCGGQRARKTGRCNAAESSRQAHRADDGRARRGEAVHFGKCFLASGPKVKPPGLAVAPKSTHLFVS